MKVVKSTKKIPKAELIKRNSKEFKKLRDDLDEILDDPKKLKKLKLFSLKPYQSVDERIALRLTNKQEKVIYDLQLDALKFNLLDSKHKLFREGKLYFFKSSSKSEYVEVPFEIAK